MRRAGVIVAWIVVKNIELKYKTVFNISLFCTNSKIYELPIEHIVLSVYSIYFNKASVFARTIWVFAARINCMVPSLMV